MRERGEVGAAVYRSRPHTAAPAKAKMSRAANRCHVKQLANVMSSGDVALCPSEYKKREGYEENLQVSALSQMKNERKAALIQLSKMFLLLFTELAFVTISIDKISCHVI